MVSFKAELSGEWERFPAGWQKDTVGITRFSSWHVNEAIFIEMS